MTTVGAWLLGLSALAPAAAKPAETPLALRPYRVLAWLRFDDSPRLPPDRQAAIQRAFENRCGCLLGEAWRMEWAPAPKLWTDAPPPAADLAPLAENRDKLLRLEIRDALLDRASPGRPFVLRAQEFDFEFQTWSPAAERRIANADSLADALFELTMKQFRPRALVLGKDERGAVQAAVQGLALQPAKSDWPLVRAGAPFHLYRDFFKRGERVSRVELAWTYLVFQEASRFRLTTRCDVVSAFRNPVTSRTRGRSQLLAIATTVAPNQETVAQFVTGRDRLPVVGYAVALKPFGQEYSSLIGVTDRRGEIAIRGENAVAKPEVCSISLRMGNVVIARFPFVPGEQSRVVAPVRVDPLLSEFSGKVLALQEAIVDNLIVRALLDKQLAFAEKNGDLAQTRAVAAAINGMPDDASFQTQLQAIKSNAEKRRESLKQPRMGRNVEQLFKQTEQMITNNLAGLKIDKIEVESVPQTTP